MKINHTEALNLLRYVALLLLTLLSVRMCLPEKVALAPAEPTSLARKLIVMPTDGIPGAFLTTLRDRLIEQHRFEVFISVQIPIDPSWIMASSGQLDAGRVATQILETCRHMSKNGEYCVILTNRDINMPDSGLRFLFAQHHKGISIVSLARMSDVNYGARMDLISVPIVFEKTLNRAIKMINKGLGLGYYGYAISADRRSVMYAPITSLADLDSIGIGYLESEIRQNNF